MAGNAQKEPGQSSRGGPRGSVTFLTTGFAHSFTMGVRHFGSLFLFAGAGASDLRPFIRCGLALARML